MSRSRPEAAKNERLLLAGRCPGSGLPVRPTLVGAMRYDSTETHRGVHTDTVRHRLLIGYGSSYKAISFCIQGNTSIHRVITDVHL